MIIFTRVDEKLIGQTGMVNVVYGSREKGGGDFQWREHALKTRSMVILLFIAVMRANKYT